MTLMCHFKRVSYDVIQIFIFQMRTLIFFLKLFTNVDVPIQILTSSFLIITQRNTYLPI